MHAITAIDEARALADQPVPEGENWLALWDLDGTLADSSHRVEYYFAQDWVRYNDPEKIADDAPYPEAVALVNLMHAHGWDTMYLTGRRSNRFDVSRDWLMRVGAPTPEYLITRLVGDPDILAEFKVKAIRRVVASGTYSRVVLFDDDPEVIRLVRENFGHDAGFLCTWYEKPAEMVRLAQG